MQTRVPRPTASRRQRGSMLIESLIAILVFSMGILAMMSVSRAGISAQSDAQSRADAARLANEVIQEIWLHANRTKKPDDVLFKESVKAFEYQPDGTDCDFSGSKATGDQGAIVDAWVAKVKTPLTGLPGSESDAYHQIKVDSTPGTGQNQVTVTVCWKAGADDFHRKHVVIGQVN